MTAKKIHDAIWLVGSGTDATARTDAHDCHCFVIFDGKSGFCVDAGTGLAADRWLDQVSQVCDPAALAGVLITHYHADHAGGAAAARTAGLPILAGQQTADALAVGDETRTQLARARDAGVYPADYRIAVCPTDQVLHGGQTVRSGAMEIEVMDTPGHCDGHLAFGATIADASVFFSGDCLFAGGRVSMQAIPDCRLDRYAETVIALAARDTDVLLPGHGDFVLARARDDIERAARAFRRLIPPPNLLTAD